MQHAKIMNLVQSEVYESSKNRVSMYINGKSSDEITLILIFVKTVTLLLIQYWLHLELAFGLDTRLIPYELIFNKLAHDRTHRAGSL